MLNPKKGLISLKKINFAFVRFKASALKALNIDKIKNDHGNEIKINAGQSNYGKLIQVNSIQTYVKYLQDNLHLLGPTNYTEELSKALDDRDLWEKDTQAFMNFCQTTSVETVPKGLNIGLKGSNYTTNDLIEMAPIGGLEVLPEKIQKKVEKKKKKIVKSSYTIIDDDILPKSEILKGSKSKKVEKEPVPIIEASKETKKETIKIHKKKSDKEKIVQVNELIEQYGDKDLASLLENAKSLEKYEEILKYDLDRKKLALLNRYSFLGNYIDKNLLSGNFKRYPIFGADTIANYKHAFETEDLNLCNRKLFINTNLEQQVLPSVSTILSVSDTEGRQKALIKWKIKKIEELGVQGFLEFEKNNQKQGESLHKAVEDYLTGTKYEEVKVDDVNEKAWASLRSILSKDLKEVLLIEAKLKHPNLMYCGRMDCLAYFKDTLYIIEWKRANNGKRKDSVVDLYDYPLQLTAYLGAFLNDPNYESIRAKHRIDRAMLVYAYANGDQPTVNCLSFHQTLFYWNQWIIRCKRFWNDLIKHEKKTFKNVSQSISNQ